MKHQKVMACTLLICSSALPQGNRTAAILPASEARNLTSLTSHHELSRRGWTPSKSDIDEAEIALAQIVQMSTKQYPIYLRIEHPEKYFRQYIGVLRANKRVVYVSAFCDNPPPKNWKTHLYFVVDGASCYWQAVYAPAAKKFIELSINGRA